MFPVFQLPLVVSDMPLDATLPRCALRGSLDPTTGIFYRAPERARIRTAQACDKCRVRKAKCSGDHPVCERCRIRGLACHYAPERRPHRWGRATEAVPDRSIGQSIPVLPFNEVRPRSRGTHGPSSRIVDAECREDVQLTKDTPGCLAIASSIEVPATSSSSDTALSDQSHRLLDVRAPKPRKGHFVSHVPLETAEPSITCERKDTGGTDDGLGVPHLEENALPLCFELNANDPFSFFEAVLAPTSPKAVNAACITPAEYCGDVDGAQSPTDLTGAEFSCHSSYCHPTGPSLVESPVEPGIPSSHQGRPSCRAGDVESPGWTPSTSLSASPTLTRSPATPTNNRPSSPFTLGSTSSFRGPYASDPHPWSLFASEVQTMGREIRTDDIGSEYTAWGEAKDRSRAFGADDMGLFLDLDAVF